MELELLISLAAFATMTLIVPGPNNLLLMASGANFGVRATLPHIFGAVLGFTILMAVSVAGLSQVILNAPALGALLKYGGACWLVWFGSHYIRAALTTSRHSGSSRSMRSRPFHFHEAVAFQWVNPGALVLAVSVTGAFAGVADTALSRTIAICAIFGTVGFLATGLWASLGLQMSSFFRSPRTGPFASGAMGLLIILTALMIATK
ncbi:MAG: LysE family translocator [Cyanobacteria bacterium P01_E01_bin.43]